MKLRACWVVAGGLAAALGGGAAAAAETDERGWKASVSVYGYAVPQQPNFVMLVAGADLGDLHLEGRYNYEALDTGSLFAGFDIACGDRLKLALTPMLGVSFGALDGLVPALRFTLTWWRLDLYTESELVIDFADPGDTFVYDWSELGLSPLSWLRIGLVVQRNRVLQSPLAIQRGALVAVTVRFATLTFYEFNLGWTDPTYVGAVALSF